MSQIIHFAIVGFGHIGKRHASTILANKNCKLISICDSDKIAYFQNKDFENVPFYEDIATMLAQQPSVEVVCICTPSGFHAQQALLILDAKKHVVCEKPMALSRVGCEAMILKAMQVGRQIFGVMQNRFSPISIWLKKIVTENILGELFFVQINCFWNRDDRYYLADNQLHTWHGNKELDGGTLFTQFSHFVDMLFWLFGDVKNIQSKLVNFSHQHSIDFEDSGFVNFDFVKKGIGTLQYSTSVWDKNLESSLTIIGSKGSIKVGGQYMERLEYCHVENYTPPVFEKINSTNNHVFVIQNVVEVLQGNEFASTNAVEGMKVVDIIERIYQSNR